jgi:hypothetical protein
MDDVIGATVTANKASTRLLLLQHRAVLSSSEVDSRYRELNDFREEESSSEWVSSEATGKLVWPSKSNVTQNIYTKTHSSYLCKDS